MDGMSTLSASDVAMLSGNGMGSNNGLFWIFALLILAGGGFGGWNRGGDYGQFATSASQQEILFGQKFSDLDNKMDRGFTSIGNGISSATFSLNNSIKDGNYATQTAIKDCCCTTQRNTDSLRFDMANYACAIQATDTANTQKILDVLAQNKIESLQGRINQLELAQATQNIVRYPSGWTYNAGNSPFCNCGNGCGCNY